MATKDADPDYQTCSQVISRLEVSGLGEEWHQMGWNACLSCHGDSSKKHRYLIVLGVCRLKLHIVDCVTNPRYPSLYTVISGVEMKACSNPPALRTVHSLGSDIIISMIGDMKGNAPAGYLQLNEDFDLIGSWKNSMGDIKFSSDFWYQPHHIVMVTSEWTAHEYLHAGL